MAAAFSISLLPLGALSFILFICFYESISASALDPCTLSPFWSATLSLTFSAPINSLLFPRIACLSEFSLGIVRLVPYAVEGLSPEVKCIYWPLYQFSSCAVPFCLHCTALLSAPSRQWSLCFNGFCPKNSLKKTEGDLLWS